MAGLLIAEAIAEAKDNKVNLILQTLDAEKAFDVVWHDSLLQKLYKDGVEGDLWLLVQSLHKNANTIVKWEGEISGNIPILQGIRQGAKLSTLMYKRFNNDLINHLQNANEGIKIGTHDISSPTCADDISLLTPNEAEAQILTNLVYETSRRDRFNINPSKCELIYYKNNNLQDPAPCVFLGGGGRIQNVLTLKHLGIERNSSNTPDVAGRIHTARKTIYALLGSGLHEKKNGLSPVITYNMWTTFVIPRLSHGIELLSIRKTDLENLERYQRKVLKRLQSLPERTASVAVLMLIGAKTIEAHIDTRIITTFLNITKDKSSVEFSLAVRQLKMKEHNSNSWFIKAAHILAKYDLPDPLFLLESIKNKKDLEYWKKQTKIGIETYWEHKLTTEIENKSTLTYINIQDRPTKYPHVVWKGSHHSPFASHKATIKAKLMTGTLLLESDKHRFQPKRYNPQCKLCKTDIEDQKHFLLKCPILEARRSPYTEKLKLELQNLGLDTIDENTKLQLIVDCTGINLGRAQKDSAI
ncbi:hypothetical protein FSP39_005338 [Pinctada imbricata]|uniref:Reverse transcriptase domain-containing protein n=1 Tax=Pinctada imbricata TaxID=66713 RepID=A0AA89BQM7_PINIB|nr:hypothetical protein FSP39_005338 [Pinctada imbricata]